MRAEIKKQIQRQQVQSVKTKETKTEEASEFILKNDYSVQIQGRIGQLPSGFHAAFTYCFAGLKIESEKHDERQLQHVFFFQLEREQLVSTSIQITAEVRRKERDECERSEKTHHEAASNRQAGAN